MNISQGAYEVGQYVRFIGGVHFTISVFLTSVDHLMDNLISKAKQ